MTKQTSEMVSFNILGVLVYQTIVYHRFTNAVKEIYKSPNVKTSLFTELDIRRTCWDIDKINLLRTRMIMQDLIPNRVPRDIRYVVEYLRTAEEAAVTHSPEGRVRRIMMLALSDVLGGYLQAVAIPFAKENYYAGNIDYATMSMLYEVLNEMKSRLHTDGGRWSRTIDMSRFPVKVSALNLPRSDSELACKALFVIPEGKCGPGMPRISVPYLDYDEKPGSVALPLRSRNLYSLKTAASSHIIVRFYILARQCLSEMPPENTEVFNNHFMAWLNTKVVPTLYDDVWYPGYGSVMRIVETINETAVIDHPRKQLKTTDDSLEASLLDNSMSSYLARLKTMIKYNTNWFLFLLLCLLLILLLLICCCCCCVWCSRTGGPLGGKSSSGMLHALLSVYCGLKEDTESQVDTNKRPTELNDNGVRAANYSYAPDQSTGSYLRLNEYKEDIDTSSSVTSTSEEEPSTVYYVKQNLED